MASKDKPIWVHCSKCGEGQRKHAVLFVRADRIYDDPDDRPVTEQIHRLVECMGCESVKYVTSYLDLQEQDAEESCINVFPDGVGRTLQRRPPLITDYESRDEDGTLLIPEPVWKMYQETVAALNANIRTLAGGGLRAVVEAICIDKQIKGKSLVGRIDELANQGFLTKTQVELLHEERYIGNSALHDIATPSSNDLEDGLGIVEGLITTIYILPDKARRMKERRQQKSNTSTSTEEEL